MKRILLAAAVVAAALNTPAQAADVGVSVSIGQPGFYGRIDIGGFPPPVLLYPEPLMIQAVPYGRPPLYLRVPPGHAKHWRKYCRRYNACGERVYFVRDDWYHQEYAPRYREKHYGQRDHDRREYREDRREDRRDRRNDRHEKRHDDDRGRGRDH